MKIWLERSELTLAICRSANGALWALRDADCPVGDTKSVRMAQVFEKVMYERFAKGDSRLLVWKR